MTLIKEYIDKNVNANIKHYFYIDTLHFEIEINGKLVANANKAPVSKLLLNLEEVFFKLPKGGQVKLFSLETGALVSKSDWQIWHDFEKCKKEWIDTIIDSISRPNVLLLDISEESRFNLVGIDNTIRMVRFLDAHFHNYKIDRVYKHYNNFFIT